VDFHAHRLLRLDRQQDPVGVDGFQRGFAKQLLRRAVRLRPPAEMSLEAAKKAAATRAANKAAKAAGDSGSVSGLVKEIDTIVSAAKQPAATAAAADEPEGEYYEWEHNFGKGNQMFVRKNVAGKAYIYIENSEGNLEYQGVFEAAKNKLNKAIADIQDTE
jgi:hypothetical protein